MLNRKTILYFIASLLIVVLCVGSLPPLVSTTDHGENSSSSPQPEESSSKTPESSEESEPPEEEPSSSSSEASSSSSSEASSSSETPSQEESSQPPAEEIPAPNIQGPYMVGYYPSYARSAGITPLDLDASRLTHIHYAFADISSQNTLMLPNPTIDQKNLAELVQLKKQNSQLAVLLSVGGWDYSYNFSQMASSSASRVAFAQSCADFLEEYGLDGIDLDWEFPGSGDRTNFTLLLQAVRGQLDSLTVRTGRPYYLSIAGSPSQGYRSSIQLGQVAGLVDYFFLMGYDMHGPWDGYADLNAPLYTPQEKSPQYSLSLQEAVDGYIADGFPANKLVMGMPFYGYRYVTHGGTETGLYSTFASASSITYAKIMAQYMGNSAFQLGFHEEARVPYLTDGETFISFDDPDSIAEKTAFARSRGLAGVGAWELTQDKNGALLRSAWQALHS